MKLEFKPQHFDSLYTLGPGLPEWAAGVAQSLLEEWLKEAPVVYGNSEMGTWSEERRMSALDTARLVDIKELKND